MGFLGGGSKSTSTSSNQNNGLLTSQLGSTLGMAGTASDALSKFMGGDASGFDAFKRAMGFNTMLNNGTQGLMGSAAARGLLRSGSTGKALVNYGQDMSNQFGQNYLGNLLNMGQLGVSAGNTLAGAGQTSSSTQKSKGGLGGFLGSTLGAVAKSERSVKTDIKKIGEFSNGLGKYSFRYKDDPRKKYIGVMVDEVEVICPEALGPVIDGVKTVNYDKLKEIV